MCRSQELGGLSDKIDRSGPCDALRPHSLLPTLLPTSLQTIQYTAKESILSLLLSSPPLPPSPHWPPGYRLCTSFLKGR